MSPSPPRPWLARVLDRVGSAAGRLTGAAGRRESLELLRLIVAQQREDAKWRRRVGRQLDALLLRGALDGLDVARPYWLKAQGFQLRSQNDEDGVILALLKMAGVTDRRFVEIGCGGSGGNAAVLAFDCGWAGLMVEADRRKADLIRRRIAFNPDVTVVRQLVTPRKLDQLLRDHGYKGEVDLLSIDVDSVDYWLLDALTVCSPRILIMEYNALFGPDLAVTLPLEGLPARRPKGYFGASLAAIEQKAREKGYRLIYCEDMGVNAFFLRNDVAPELAAVPVKVAYRPLLSRRGLFGADERPLDVFALIESEQLPLTYV